MDIMIYIYVCIYVYVYNQKHVILPCLKMGYFSPSDDRSGNRMINHELGPPWSS